MINLLKIITIPGILLGSIMFIISIIKWKKIRREFENTSEDELVTKEDKKRLKKFLLLRVAGIFIVSSIGILWSIVSIISDVYR